MRKTHSRVVVAVVLGLTLSVLMAGTAFALSSTTGQTTPGVTSRVIWDDIQVGIYKLPTNVTHNGYMHFEVKFKPDWGDADIYIMNSAGNTVGGIAGEEMGYLASFNGKEVVDFRVTNVVNKTVVRPEYGDPYIPGDEYYLVIVAFNESLKFQIWGYYPQIDIAASESTTSAWNYYLESYRKPSSTKDWISLKGPQYGGPYDFKPTSEGQGEARLEWPADTTMKKVTYDPVNAPSPANCESYLYAGSDWDTVFENYGDGNWTPDSWPLDAFGPAFYGLLNTWDVVDDPTKPSRPQITLHYTPSLFAVTSNPLLGKGAPPKTGKSTIGIKATLFYPENLRLKSAPSDATKGKKFTVKGTFALNKAWQVGMPVQIERSYDKKVWTKIKLVNTLADGSWSAKISLSKTAYVRAKAVGDDTTGLATEYSIMKKIKVKK